jgi:hypothetical protein
MLLPAAMLAEQVSWKGTTARFAAYNIVSIRTTTVGTSFSSLCGHAIGYHGEWKRQLEVVGCAFVDISCIQVDPVPQGAKKSST